MLTLYSLSISAAEHVTTSTTTLLASSGEVTSQPTASSSDIMSSSTTADAVASPSTASPTSTLDAKSSSNPGLSDSEKAGIGLGVALGVIALALIVFLFRTYGSRLNLKLLKNGPGHPATVSENGSEENPSNGIEVASAMKKPPHLAVISNGASIEVPADLSEYVGPQK